MPSIKNNLSPHSGKQKTRRILMTSQEPGAVGQHAVGNAESEAGDRDSSPHRSQHPVAQLLQPQSPLFNSDGSQTPPQQQDDDIASPASPPPVVFAASFDIEQQSDDEQESDRFKFKPSHQNPGHTKPQRIGLIPIKDLKRSHSATDALNISGCPYTASTEYPYVLHAFEVVGRSPTHIGSLPNILEHRFLEDQATNPCTDEAGNPSGTANFQVDTATDDSNSDTDEEPSYSYADRRHMTAKDLPPRKSKLPSIVKPAANQDYHYDEYPSAWNPTSQLLQSVSQYSDEHTTDTHDQTEPSALPSNQVLPQNQNNNGTQDNPLPPKPKVKPPIKPRKKLAYQIKPNHAILHFPTGVNTATEKGHQPPSSSLVIPNKGSTNEAGAGARLAAQTGPTYMKLLETTKDEHHRYTYLFDGANGLGERSLSNLDPERAHPNEWCKLAKC